MRKNTAHGYTTGHIITVFMLLTHQQACKKYLN